MRTNDKYPIFGAAKSIFLRILIPDLLDREFFLAKKIKIVPKNRPRLGPLFLADLHRMFCTTAESRATLSAIAASERQEGPEYRREIIQERSACQFCKSASKQN